jgi:hypothetical protein
VATTDEEKAEEKSATTYRYKFIGTKGPGEKVDRLVLEGTSANPIRYIDVGGEGEMTEAEAETVRAEHGLVLRKVGEPDSSDNADDAPIVTTRAQQQAAQAGPGSTTQGKSSDKPSKS